MRRAIFDDEHEQFRRTARTYFEKECVPHVDEWEKAGCASRDAWLKAGAQGLLGWEVPEEYGGAGISDFRFNAILTEEYWATGSVGIGLGLQNDIMTPYLVDLTTEEQKRRWLPGFCTGEIITAIAMSEPGAGSDVRALRTTARRDGDEFVINGTKTFISNGVLADLVLVACKTDPAAGHRGISLIGVETGTPGFSRGRRLDKIGQHAADTAELVFDDVRVPVANLVGAENEGFYHLMRNLPKERLGIAVHAVAGAQRALEITLAYAQDREAFGQPIGTFQVNRHALAQMLTKIEVMQSHLDRCIVAVNAGELTAAEAAGAKWWTTETQWELALEMGAEAARAALADAGLDWSRVRSAFVGSYEVANPDAIVGWLGLTGIPVRGVFNGCATGGTSLQMAAAAIRHGDADVAMAIGMDKHPRGAFAADPSVVGLPAWYGQTGLFLTTHFFGTKINRYLGLHGISMDSLARVAAKNLANGAITPHAWRRKPLSVPEILGSEVVNYPLTRYMYCNPCEGAAALVLCRADLARELTSAPVYVRAAELRSRRHGAFELQSPSLPLESAPSPTVDASAAAYEAAGIGPGDVQVAQLQDTDAGSELIHMAENGFCADGEQEKWIAEGATEIGGRLPVNTDGGLIANGEPIGASGLRQLYEIVLQLQGRAGDRQVPGDPRVGYTHLYGAPGASAVTILSR